MQVIYLTEAIDEYLTQNLTEYEDKKFQNASKDDLKIGSKDEKAKFKEVKESYKELTKWWKDLLVNENVESVKVSKRLANTPGVVVTSKFGWSANMERIMQAQTLADPSKQAYMRGKRILEINPRHPIIKELREKVALSSEDEGAKEVAKLVYETALVESGFILEDPKDFATRIYSVIRSTLNVDPDAEIEEEDETEDEIEKEESQTPTEEINRNPEPQEEDINFNEETEAEADLVEQFTDSEEDIKDEL
jgi:heat shock protein beta